MNYYIILISILLVICLAFSFQSFREHFFAACLGCPINKFEWNPRPQEIIFADQNQQFIHDCDTFVSGQPKLTKVPRKIWIYYPYQKNSRHWWDYGSRLHYQEKCGLFIATLQNLRKKLPNYEIIVLDQTNVEKLTNIPGGLLENEMLIQATIMYKYGGIWLPAYSYPILDIDWMLEETLMLPYITDKWNSPSPAVSLPGQKLWRDMIYYIAYNPLTLSDYSDFNKFWYFVQCNKGQIRLVNGGIFGQLDRKGRDITFINLTAQADTELYDDCCLVCIDKGEELRRDTQWIILYNCQQLAQETKTLWISKLLS